MAGAAVITLSVPAAVLHARVAQDDKPTPNPALVRAEFIFETAPFRSAHASTIVDTRGGLVVAWFGGTKEGAPDVGIWVSREVGGKWTPPVEVATGAEADGTRHPCWNPVLFEMPDRTLTLFYKVGPSPQTWWGMFRTSQDGGRSWSDARRLPDGILGPIKNKPVRLSDGTILSPRARKPRRPRASGGSISSGAPTGDARGRPCPCRRHQVEHRLTRFNRAS